MEIKIEGNPYSQIHSIEATFGQVSEVADEHQATRIDEKMNAQMGGERSHTYRINDGADHFVSAVAEQFKSLRITRKP